MHRSDQHISRRAALGDAEHFVRCGKVATLNSGGGGDGGGDDYEGKRQRAQYNSGGYLSHDERQRGQQRRRRRRRQRLREPVPAHGNGSETADAKAAQVAAAAAAGH